MNVKSASPTMQERFRGALLGLAVGDGLGAMFEGQTADWIARRFPDGGEIISNPPRSDLRYTDDTQMAIGVAETLIEHGEIDEAGLCANFAANYDPPRGYGHGARTVLQAMVDGEDHQAIAARQFRGGSFGNGGAMRVAPVGLAFYDNLDRVWEQARFSALPTHVHPLGIEGAQLVAAAVAICLQQQQFNANKFYGLLGSRAESFLFRDKLQLAAKARSMDDVAELGNGIAAQDSVATAIACFAMNAQSYAKTIESAILLGGDTDTIAAMAGAISGALLGVAAIPHELANRLEDGHKGRSYILELADKLYARFGGSACT